MRRTAGARGPVFHGDTDPPWRRFTQVSPSQQAFLSGQIVDSSTFQVQPSASPTQTSKCKACPLIPATVVTWFPMLWDTKRQRVSTPGSLFPVHLVTDLKWARSGSLPHVTACGLHPAGDRAAQSLPSTLLCLWLSKLRPPSTQAQTPAWWLRALP